MELKFVNTCPACPEQYDVFDNDEDVQVGYVRVRHGYMSVRCPSSQDDEIYGANIKGDGTFYDKEERAYYLTKAAEEIVHHLTYDNDFDTPGDFIVSV